MNRKQKNIGLLGANLVLVIIITILFLSDIRSFYTTPRFASIFSIFIAVMWSFFMCGFLKRIHIIVTDERFSKLQDHFDSILMEDESFLQAYAESVLKQVAIQEPIFRWVPFGLIFILGLFISPGLHSILVDVITMGATAMWLVIYEDRLLHLLPYGPLFFVFLSSGMIIQALIAHLLINTLVYFAIIIDYEIEMYER